ncbi:hypothetical protein [Joostella sp. CR20]|uniref:hypothetical protein n=1 Tax=Joostella sp. CR20 TaxID=2804312 RepID=UPI00313ACD66
MTPEFLLRVCYALIFFSVILGGAATFGTYYYNDIIAKKDKSEINDKLDDIPSKVLDNNNQNTDKIINVLDGMNDTLQEIAETDGSNIKTLTYPSKGEYGLNILDRNKKIYSPGTYSMRVEIPKGQSVTVKVKGDNWSYPLFQSIPGWRSFDYNLSEKSRKFKSIKPGIIDLEIHFTDASEIKIEVFENDSTKPNWEKEMTVK